MSELKVLIKPMLDKSSTKRMQSQLGKTTAKAPTARASGGGGSTAGGLLAGGGIGKALAGMAASLALVAAGVGVLVLGIGMVLKRLAQSSPMLAGVLNMFKVAIDMFLLPIGNMVARWLVPLAKSAIRFAQGFNKVFGERGFWGAMTWALKTVLSAYLTWSMTSLKNNLKTILETVPKIYNFLKTLPDKLVKAIKEGLNVASGAVDNASSSIQDAVGWKSLGLYPFAKGGVVTEPTPALVGEAGPEAIIPLDKMQSGITIQFNGNVYGMNDFERQVQTIVNRYGNRRNYA